MRQRAGRHAQVDFRWEGDGAVGVARASRRIGGATSNVQQVLRVQSKAISGSFYGESWCCWAMSKGIFVESEQVLQASQRKSKVFF